MLKGQKEKKLNQKSSYIKYPDPCFWISIKNSLTRTSKIMIQTEGKNSLKWDYYWKYICSCGLVSSSLFSSLQFALALWIRLKLIGRANRLLRHLNKIVPVCMKWENSICCMVGNRLFQWDFKFISMWLPYATLQ